MLISVIIPAYNTEKYIGKCLHSVVNQSYKDIEIIVINDASTDSTLDIINQYRAKDNRIRLINQPVNKGCGYCRNQALRIAKGYYIMYVDSDDQITPNAVELLVNEANRNGNPDAVFMAYKSVIYDKNNIIKREFTQLPQITCDETPEQLFIYYLLTRRVRIQAWAYFVRKQYLFDNEIFFSEDGLYFEDMLYTAKLFYHIKTIAKLDEPVYFYNQRAGSIIHSWTEKNINDRTQTVLSVKAMLKEHNDFVRFQSCYIYYFINTAYVTSFLTYIKMDKTDKAISAYFKELGNQPFIKYFHRANLKFPEIAAVGPNDKSYKFLKRTTYSISHHFGWTLFWLRSWIKLSNLFHPYSEVA